MNYPNQSGGFPGCCVSSHHSTGKITSGSCANIGIFDNSDPELKVYKKNPEYIVTRGDSMTIVSGNPQFQEKKRHKAQWDEHCRLQKQDGREAHEFKVGDTVFSPYYDGYGTRNYFRRVMEVNGNLVGLSIQFVKNNKLPPNLMVAIHVSKEQVLRTSL